MKKIIKLFVFTLVSFLFINTVNADLKCKIDFVRESGINTAQFDVKMPKCVLQPWDGSSYTEVTGKSGFSRQVSYSKAYDLGPETIDAYYERESADGKSIISGKTTIPVCTNTKRRPNPYGKCTAEKSATPGYCSNYSLSNCPSYCSKGATSCYGTYYYCSGENWTRKGNKCYKEFTIGEKDFAGKDIGTSSSPDCKTITGEKNCTCKIEYALDCPARICKVETVKIGACTPEFIDKNGNYAYCINPGQGFSGDYKEDTSFDVRKCSTSYVTPDCGFANILIEGAFHYQKGNKEYSTHNDVINLALRLWSYHTNQGGFSGKTGIANREYLNNNCNTSAYFYGGKNRPNVYKETYKYIMKNLFESAQDVINKSGYLPNYLRCNGKFDPENCRSAFTGNTFEEITCKDAPTGVTCGGSYVYRAAFELFFNTLLGNKYMITHLDNLSKVEGKWVTTTNVTLSEKDKKVWIVTHYEKTEYEKVFGEYEEISCNPNDDIFKENPTLYDEIKDYCKTEVIYFTPDGKSHETNPEYCKKHDGCWHETNESAICRTETGGSSIYKVLTRDSSNPNATSIKKLIPCGTLEENQIMFEYSKYNKEDKEEKPYTESEFYTNYNCKGGKKCTDTEVRVSKKCKSPTDLGTETIADPSLSCIVNMKNEEAKTLYDFSSRYGINTNFCRIYCSDKVDYYIAGDTYATENRFFTYDVRSSASNSGLKNGKDLLTSVVKQKRTCVSEIFVDHLPNDVDWKGTYGLDDKQNEKLMNNKTFSNLFNIMAEKAMHERNRTENLYELLYDIYNCHLFNLEPSTIQKKYGFYKPGKIKTDYAWKTIQADYSGGKQTQKYGIVDVKQNSDTITYNGGAAVADSSGTSIKGYLGKEYPIKAGVINTGDVTTGSSLVRKTVKYCKGTGCLKYDGSDDYKYTEFENFKNSYYIKYLDKGHDFDFKYPTANYAMFQVSNEVGFYNKDLYQTYGGSGYISIVGDKGPSADLLTLDKYTYQLASNAYAVCGGQCEVKQAISISPFFRATTSFKDTFKDKIANNEVSCSTIKVGHVTCPPGDPECVNGFGDYYRIADPAKLFPYANEDYTENVGENWQTPEGQEAIKVIQGTAAELTTTDNLLEYSITLTPEQIKNIQGYNNTKVGDSYSNKRYYSLEHIQCDKNNISENKDRYANCSSDFFKALTNSKTEEFGTLSPDYRGTSKYNSKH